MRIFIFPATILMASAAQAHPGHLIEAAGHDHWLGAAAIGAAIAIGLWKAAKDRRDQAVNEEAEEAETEPQEA